MVDRLLIVDDDRRLSAMVADYLSGVGYSVDHRESGQDGIAALAREVYDAVILDVMLPDLDGLEVLRRLRIDSSIPVLMLTARGEETDRIVGLEIGADGYLPKPFNPRELLARIRAILRRRASAVVDNDVLRFGRLLIDRGSRTVKLDGSVRSLTGYQFDLLVAS